MKFFLVISTVLLLSTGCWNRSDENSDSRRQVKEFGRCDKCGKADNPIKTLFGRND